MQLEGSYKGSGGRRVIVAALLFVVLVLAVLFAWQLRFALPERPTIAVLPIEATDTFEETRDLADHLTKRIRTIIATRPELRVTESRSAMHDSLVVLDMPAKAAALGADLLLGGTLTRSEGRLRLGLRLSTGQGEELWAKTFESPVFYQAQMQGWVVEELWPQLPLDPQGLDAALHLVADCHYPEDAMAILTLARTGRRGGGPASLAMVATADIEAGLLHLAQAQFYFGQIDTLPESQQPVIEALAVRSLGRAAGSCPDHPDVELLRLIYTGELPLDTDNAPRYLQRHPNSADLYLAVAELYGEAGSGRRARAYAHEAVLLDPLDVDTRCRARGLLASDENEGGACD